MGPLHRWSMKVSRRGRRNPFVCHFRGHPM